MLFILYLLTYIGKYHFRCKLDQLASVFFRSLSPSVHEAPRSDKLLSPDLSKFLRNIEILSFCILQDTHPSVSKGVDPFSTPIVRR